MAPPTQSPSDDFIWIGTVGGDWQTPSNWEDLTTGTNPSDVAPGGTAAVTIASTAFISGVGTAAELSILGTASTGTPATLAGTFDIGLIALLGYAASLTLDPSSMVEAGSVDLSGDYAGGMTISGTDAILDDAGVLSVGYASSLTAIAGGQGFFAGIGAAGTIGMVVADTLSSLELGTIGDAAAGMLVIDAGQTVTLASAVAPVIDINGEVEGISANLTAASVDVDGLVAASAADVTGTLGGTGTILVSAEFVDTTGFAADSALTFVAGGALVLSPSVPLSTAITLTGSTALLAFAPGAPAVAGGIAGLVLGDDLLVTTPDPIAEATYVAGATDRGTLVLTDAGGTQIGFLSLVGSYAGDTFLVTPLSADGSVEQINIAGRGNGVTSPLTDKYQWIGPSGGAWDLASNWADLTSSAGALLPPGSSASATILGGAADSLYTGEATLPIVGPGAVGDLTLIGNVALAGQDTAGETDLTSGTLTVGPQGTLISGYVVMTTLGLAISVHGSGAVLDAGYGLELFTEGPPGDQATSSATSDILSVADGGRATLAAAALGFGSTLIVNDGASAIEIGNADTVSPGELTIDPGTAVVDSSGLISDFTAAQSALVAPTIINNGTVSVEVDNGEYTAPQLALALDGTLEGSGVYAVAGSTNEFTRFGTFYGHGQIIANGEVQGSLTFLVGSLADLALPDVVGAGDSITFDGTSASVSFTGDVALAVGAPISGFATGDSIGIAVADTVASAIFTQTSATGGTLALSDAGGSLVGDLFLNGIYAPHQFAVSDGDITLGPPCFTAATRIATPHGPIAVEALSVGQLVVTNCGETTPVVWLGHRTADCRRHPRPELVWPVRVAVGAFAARRPARPLWLSPDHAVFVDGVLIPIKHLINGHSIAQVAVPRVEYWHVELDRHDIILAENLPTESYLDTGNRMAFANVTPTMLHPDFERQRPAESCAELLQDGAALVAIKRHLFRRAAITAGRPALRFRLRGGRHILAPTPATDGAWSCSMPPGEQTLQIESPTWMPAACNAESLDRRRLGVRVHGLTADGRIITLDDRVFDSGFHAPEVTAEGACRWTNGQGRLRLPHFTRRLVLRVGDDACLWDRSSCLTGNSRQDTHPAKS